MPNPFLLDELAPPADLLQQFERLALVDPIVAHVFALVHRRELTEIEGAKWCVVLLAAKADELHHRWNEATAAICSPVPTRLSPRQELDEITGIIRYVDRPAHPLVSTDR